MKHCKWLLFVGLLAFPLAGQAQDITFDSAGSAVRTLNNELEASLKKKRLSTKHARRALLEHIKARQVYYRLVRVARKANRWAFDVKGVKPINLPKRPKGEILPEHLEALAKIATSQIRKTNKMLGISQQRNAGTTPGQTPGHVYSILARTVDYLDTLGRAQYSQLAAASEPAAPAPSKKRRKRR